MRLYKIFCLLSFALAGLKLTQGKRDFKIILKKCEFIIKRPQIMRHVNCSTPHSATDPDQTFLSGGFELAKNVTEFNLDLSFDMLRKDNTKINLLTQHIDGCQFLQGKYGHTLLKNVLLELRRSSDLPKKCPVMSHIYYSINNFALNEEDYPVFLPALSFVFMTKFYMNQVHEGDLILNGRIKKI